jgi:hypothetical protein
MAYQLLTDYGNSTEIKGYVDKYDFYIFPVVNPDGDYPYSPIVCIVLTMHRVRLLTDQ